MREALIDGGNIRKLWIGEAGAYRDHLLRLDLESRRNRFGAAISEEIIGRYVDDAISAEAVIHGFFCEGSLRGAAELRASGSMPVAEAEAAFSVEKPWQSLGVGTALLERTLLTARNRGIKRLRMICLTGNRRMQQLALKFDADLSFDIDSVIGELESPRPTPISVMRELLVESHALTSAVLDVQSRLLRTASRP
jgi:GNAT superfamily N-acetyltransferase